MIATNELNEYLEEYLEEKQEVKNLTQETIKKQTFNISKFISFLEDKGVEEHGERADLLLQPLAPGALA